MTMLLALAAGLIAAYAAYRWAVEAAEVGQTQAGLLYRRGRFVRVLEPGRYLLVRPWRRERVALLDTRLVSVAVPGQEILTADALAVRLTVIAQYRVAAPEKAAHETVSYASTLYEDLQLALRELVAALTLEELLTGKTALGAALTERARPKAQAYGLRLESAGVKDIVLPGSLRALMQSVEEARQAAKAKLVSAREELAAARVQLNTAKLMAEHPLLLRLRELEVMSEAARKPNGTLVLSAPADLLAKPKV